MTRILIVEDSRHAQLLLDFLLRPDYEIHVTDSIDEALQVAQEQHFDLLILDINLGEKRTGVHLLAQLRQLPAYQHTPAIALTSYRLPSDTQRLMEAGFIAHIPKPFDQRTLKETIAEVVRNLGGEHLAA